MVKTTLLTAALTLLLSVQAHATCEVDPEGPVKKIHVITTEASCEDAQLLAREMKKLSEQLGRSAYVTFVYGGRSDNASFDDSRLIKVPHAFIHRGPHGEELTGRSYHLSAIVAHEYGHAILSKIWRVEFKEEFESIFNELDLYSDDTESAIDNKDEMYTPKFFSSEDFKVYLKTMGPYTELYADVIAVYFYNDPSIMLNSLYFDELNDWYFRYLQLRDFSRNHKEAYVSGFTDPHAKLALVRSFIGRELMPKTVVQKRKYLTWIEKAITRSVREDIKANKIPDTLELNKRVIRYLREIKKSAK